MSVITIFSGNFCNEDAIVKDLVKATGYKMASQEEIVKKASSLSKIAETKISEAFLEKTSIFNKFTHEKERSIAYLRLALATMLENGADEGVIYCGFPVHLIPVEINHVLRTCLIADLKHRVKIAEAQGQSEKAAIKLIKDHEKNSALWVKNIFSSDDPWNISLYDMVIPVDKSTVKDAVALIVEKSKSGAVEYNQRSKGAVDDFLLSARVETALADEGHNIGVSSKNGAVKLTINNNVLMLKKLEEDIKAIAQKVSGVISVGTEIGKSFYQADIYRKYDFQTPSKVLLVDDEREFVQTLSERLMLRDMTSAVAYDGESALSIVDEDEPEVMILDLKMPGIDGIEVLRKVKSTKPEIEVIILTGHGSEADRKICMELGAFAYLHKPVDIDLLSQTLKQANEKIKKNLQK
ncbi:MAG: response regulator [Desulfamplus sp.]|nr:response regulator [Desulfamplus sp.]MBF0390254.1 response regulator [Desulfamplus sp.]